MSVLLIVSGYLLYWLIRGTNKSNKANNINAEYKKILDDKLTPLDFECKQIADNPREKTISYKHGTLVVVLHFEPPFSFNQIRALSGKKITLQEHIDQMSPEIRKKATFLHESDKDKLVDTPDFSMELSESEDARIKFMQTLDNWLAENQ
jgi:hypothetical protein